ncbi:hypothetical protein AMK27_38175 [Streptomyces sp. CB02009]|nr:hypothetical protein AMK27_38175 [Streptomyces sp. CB02009]
MTTACSSAGRTLQATLDEQRRVRAEERRLHAYATVLNLVDTCIRSEDADDFAQLEIAHNLVELEGPSSVAWAWTETLDVLRHHCSGQNLFRQALTARTAYVTAVRQALGLSDD